MQSIFFMVYVFKHQLKSQKNGNVWVWKEAPQGWSPGTFLTHLLAQQRQAPHQLLAVCHACTTTSGVLTWRLQEFKMDGGDLAVPKPRACRLHHHSIPIATIWPSMKSKADHDKGLGHSISSLCCPSEPEAMRPGWTALIYSITVPALLCGHQKRRGAGTSV